MEELLTHTYYGNTLLEWLTALAIILAAVVLGKIVYWIFGKIARRVTAKTETSIDDVVLDMVEEPVVLVLTIGGIWYGLNTLELPDLAHRWIGHVLQAAIILTAAWLLTRLSDSLFKQYLVPLAASSQTDLDDQLLPILRKGTKMIVWSVGVIVALNNAGYDVGALIAGLGIGGLALAMAAKDTISNVFGGYTIFTDRPFKLNDRVKVAGYDGFIREIGVRSTRLETLEGRLVTIPNSKFSDSPLENVSAEPSRKVVSNLGLTYDTTPEQMRRAIEILNTIASKNENLEKKVLTSFNAFGDFAMNILFIYYIKSGSDILGTTTDVNMAVLTEFNQAGLDFAFPTQTIYTKEL